MTTLVFCLVISVLLVVVCYYDADFLSGDQKSVLLLLVSNEDGHKKMNDELENMINRNDYDIDVRRLHINNATLTETISIVNTNRNDYVVNLKIVDFYKESTLPSDLIFHENGATITDPFCVIDIAKTNKETSCEVKDVELQEMAAFSKNILDIKDIEIIEILSNFNINNNKEHTMPTKKYATHIILICSQNENAIDSDYKEKLKANSNPVELIFSECNTEMKIPDNTSAVLAPKPLQFSSFNPQIPFIFYDSNHLLPVHEEDYPNSYTLLPWQPLKYALVKFLQKMKWQRIAVISDDSYFSDEFEKELISLLHENDFVYTVKQCLYNINSSNYDPNLKTCTFDKGLNELRNQEYKVWVIIANVEIYNLEKLTRAARDLGIRGVQWIFRHPYNDDTKHIPDNIGDIYYIKLSPSGTNAFNDLIYTGIEYIKKALFYGNMNITFPISTVVRATITKRYYTFRGIIDIDGTKSSVIEMPHAYISDLSDCYIRSNDFDKPCDNFLLCLLFLVIIMFMLILLIIVIYFSNIHTTYGQYSNIL
ncbi:uncharacterized protein LOC113512061 [Galleria mellonella]|uniref:Uncharacterized protein LOC113512061 n=1 Tax=Galleria mellonella TaxID=7137 RepID=A0A6J1WDJ6_GALME|nr:uncharacterized protein LOC113512061 [Galleria mellonella]